MKNFSISIQILALTAMVFLPSALLAQETKKEVHIKIVEDGVVKKDTVYEFTGESPEIEYYALMAEHQAQMEEQRAKMAEHRAKMKEQRAKMDEYRAQMREEQVIMLNDSSDSNFEWAEKDGKHKEVRVMVREEKGDAQFPRHEVEEIWLGTPGEGRPCRTIIIHEGDCQGQHMKMREFRGEGPGPGQQMAPPPVPPRPGMGDKNVQVEKKVIKTKDGEKVIITETITDDQEKENDKKKK